MYAAPVTLYPAGQYAKVDSLYPDALTQIAAGDVTVTMFGL